MSEGRHALFDGLEREVATMMSRVRRAVGDRARAVHPDLQPGGYLILAALDRDGSARASALCAELGIDKAAVSRQVQQLLELGLIDSRVDPDDKRATLLSVTKRGHARLSVVGTARRASFEQRLGDWSDADLDSFLGLLGRYNATLG